MHVCVCVCVHTPQEARAIKEECEGILAEALPALNAAIAALDTIKKADIQLVQVWRVYARMCVCVCVRVRVLHGEHLQSRGRAPKQLSSNK